jgi:hypothetical protein
VFNHLILFELRSSVEELIFKVLVIWFRIVGYLKIFWCFLLRPIQLFDRSLFKEIYYWILYQIDLIGRKLCFDKEDHSRLKSYILCCLLFSFLKRNSLVQLLHCRNFGKEQIKVFIRKSSQCFYLFCWKNNKLYLL